MNSLEYQEKAHRTTLMNTAQYSMKRRRFAFLANHFCTLFSNYPSCFLYSQLLKGIIMYTPRWSELPRIYWRWSLLKVALFGYRNHHQFQEAFHGEQLHPALQHGQYPVMWYVSCLLLFYYILSILVIVKIACFLNMMYTRFNSKE